MYIADGDYIKDIEVNDLRNRYTLTKGSTQKMVNTLSGLFLLIITQNQATEKFIQKLLRFAFSFSVHMAKIKSGLHWKLAIACVQMKIVCLAAADLPYLLLDQR